MCKLGLVADPDIQLGDHINPDIRLGGASLICFPVSRVISSLEEGTKSIAKLDGGLAGFPQMDPPLDGAEVAANRTMISPTKSN